MCWVFSRRKSEKRPLFLRLEKIRLVVYFHKKGGLFAAQESPTSVGRTEWGWCNATAAPRQPTIQSGRKCRHISENGRLNMKKELAGTHCSPHRNEPGMPKHSLRFLHSLPLKSTKNQNKKNNFERYLRERVYEYTNNSLMAHFPMRREQRAVLPLSVRCFVCRYEISNVRKPGFALNTVKNRWHPRGQNV